MLPEFDLLHPKTIPEALAILAEHGADAMPIAGGTNVLVDLRAGKHQPRVLVDVARLPGLRGIQRDNGHLVIGGGTTISDLLFDPLVAQHAPALKEAAAVFANPLIRNRATVGGNLADASPAADTAPPLLALDAEVELASQGGTRRVPLVDFLVGVRKTLRRPDELLIAVRFPVPSSGTVSHFQKVGLRRADAISVLSAAVAVTCDAAGRCTAARIALGALAPRPLRATAAETAAGWRKTDARGHCRGRSPGRRGGSPDQRHPRLSRLPPAGDRGDRAAAVGEGVGCGGGGMKPELVTLHINGRTHTLALAPNVTLLHALRDLGYVDVKCGCEQGDCGACAVMLDGVAVNSCLVLAGQADGCQIVTAAGLGSVKQPHPLHEAFADSGAIQCGYCTPGFIIAAKALLDRTPHPTEAEIREAISGNLCRCTGYGQIVEAVQIAAERLADGK